MSAHRQIGRLARSHFGRQGRRPKQMATRPRYNPVPTEEQGRREGRSDEETKGRPPGAESAKMISLHVHFHFHSARRRHRVDRLATAMRSRATTARGVVAGMEGRHRYRMPRRTIGTWAASAGERTLGALGGFSCYAFTNLVYHCFTSVTNNGCRASSSPPLRRRRCRPTISRFYPGTPDIGRRSGPMKI